MSGRVSKAPRGRGRGGRGDGGGRGALEPSRPSGQRGRSLDRRRDRSPDRSPEVDDKPPTGWFNSRLASEPFGLSLGMITSSSGQ